MFLKWFKQDKHDESSKEKIIKVPLSKTDTALLLLVLSGTGGVIIGVIMKMMG